MDLDANQNLYPKLKNSEILSDLSSKLKHLPEKEAIELMSLIKDYKGLFSDIPRKSTMAQHDVDVGEEIPVKQRLYRMNLKKMKLLEKEIKYLLTNRIIEHGQGEWTSLCVLVDKPDGTVRFCTDYRKVNSIMKTDAYTI